MAKLHSTLPAPEDIWIASASFLTPGPRLTFPTTRLLAATPLFTSPSCAITPTWPWCFCTPGLISTWLVLKPFQALLNWDAAIAQWIRLCLPPCRPRFESQARHLRFCHLQSILRFICHVKRTKINKKRPGLAHLKNIIKLNSETHSLRQQTSLRIIVRKYKQPIFKISPRVNKYFWATFLIKMLPRTFKHHQIWSHCSTNALIKC